MSARGLVRDLGLPEHRIRFERPATYFCDDILSAARMRNQLKALHAFLRVQYGENAALLIAAAEVESILATFDDAGGILETGTSPPPERPAPSQLLDARYEVVPWHARGRADVLAELDAWADGGEASSAWLLHAEGGIGKTRLALEWARRRRAADWCAGFLPKQPPEGWADDLCAWDAPLLIVIDYAESRSDLTKLLSQLRAAHATGGGPSLRVLLLARNDGDWFRSLVERKDELAAWLSARSPRELGPVAVKPAHRTKVFDDALMAFATVRQKPAAMRPPVAFDDARFERVLYLHMAALAAVEGLSFDAGGLMDAILDHEERFWERRAREDDDLDFAAHLGLARQLVVAATLRGALLTKTEARDLLERFASRALDREGDKLIMLLHRVYGRRDEEAWQPGLEPDLLGEALVVRITSLPTTEQKADEGWIERVFPAESDEPVVRHGFEVLGRASVVRSHVIRQWLQNMLASGSSERVVPAFEAAKSVGHRTAFSAIGSVLAEHLESRGDVGAAIRLNNAGMPWETVSLSRVMVWVYRSLLSADAEMNGFTPLKRGVVLTHLSHWLIQIGEISEAVRSAQQGVAALKEVSDESARTFLATCLNTYAIALRGTGNYNAAIVASTEAVALRRASIRADSPQNLLDLAKDLDTLASLYVEGNKREQKAALQFLEEAVAILRDVATREPERVNHDLAICLDNMALMLDHSGRTADALKVSQESLAIWRALAESHPDRSLRNFATCLFNIAGMKLRCGLHDEAIALIREAASIDRRLAEHGTIAALLDLEKSLHLMCRAVLKDGPTGVVLEYLGELIALQLELSLRDPEHYLPRLAESLFALPVCSDPNDREYLLKTYHMVVDKCRRIECQDRNLVNQVLASSLLSVGVCCGHMRRLEEALLATREAVSVFRSLSSQNRWFANYLAVGLVNLASSLNNLGQVDAALQAITEASEVLYQCDDVLPMPEGVSVLSPIAPTLVEQQLAATVTAIEMRSGGMLRVVRRGYLILVEDRRPESHALRKAIDALQERHVDVSVSRHSSQSADPAGLRIDNEKTLAAAQKVGRNTPCPCGSGKKWKKCCGG